MRWSTQWRLHDPRLRPPCPLHYVIDAIIIIAIFIAIDIDIHIVVNSLEGEEDRTRDDEPTAVDDDLSVKISRAADGVLQRDVSSYLLIPR